MKRAIAVLALGVLAACGEQVPPAPAIELYALDCGRANFTNLDAFADDGSMAGVARELVVPCFLIRHPSGDLLWDAGFNDAVHDMPDGLLIELIGMRVTVPTTLMSQLQQIGVTAADIDFISFSHSHGDHTGNAWQFPNARWIADADERAFMFRDEARNSPEFPAVAHLESVTPTLIEGDGDHDVFGDGSVTIIQTPGHTPGHTVLLVRLPNAGPVLLTGDMFHLAESRAQRLVPRFNTDRAQTLASMDKIERIATETGARVIRQHVPEDINALPRFPEALN